MRYITILKAVITSVVLTFLNAIEPFTDDIKVYEQIDSVIYDIVEQDNQFNVDYFIVETVTFKDGDTQSSVFNVPKDYNASDEQNNMLDIINNIIKKRGFVFSGIDDNNSFCAVIDNSYLEYLEDKSDGWISDVDSFDYASSDELEKNMWKYGTAWIGFGLFFTFSTKLKSCFDFFIKNKRSV